MISSNKFIKIFLKKKINYFVGVPDSVLTEFINSINHFDKNIISRAAVNEGSAVALAAGYYLATKKIPLVYFQNSGLGHAINPLTSLADERVYSIPMIVLVGQRGAPNIPDEPQHKKMGPQLINIIKASKYKCFKINASNFIKSINEAVDYSKKNSCPVFLIVDKNFFLKNNKNKNKNNTKKNQIKRYDYINLLFEKKFVKNNTIIGGTGFVSRELYFIATKFKKIKQCFFNIGAMGHANQIGLEVAINSKKKVIILDGDGAIQMHMGNLALLGKFKNEKILHIIFNNKVHESTGEQVVANSKINYKLILKGCGYAIVKNIYNLNQFSNEIKKPIKKLTSLIIHVGPGSIDKLPRPKEDLGILKKIFQKKIL